MSCEASVLRLVCRPASAPSRAVMLPPMLPPVTESGRGGILVLDEELSAAGVVGLQAVDGVAAGDHGHAADADVHAAVGLGGGGNVDLAGQVLDFLLALIHQIVGGAAAGLGHDDLLVEGGDVAQVLVAGGDVVLDGGVQVAADLAEVGGDLVELGGDFLRALHRRGRVARAGGQAGKGIEEIGELGGQAAGAGGGGAGGVGDLFAQVGLGILQGGLLGGEGAGGAVFRLDLVVQQAVAHFGDGDHVGAGAFLAGGGFQRGGGLDDEPARGRRPDY